MQARVTVTFLDSDKKRSFTIKRFSKVCHLELQPMKGDLLIIGDENFDTEVEVESIVHYLTRAELPTIQCKDVVINFSGSDGLFESLLNWEKGVA